MAITSWRIVRIRVTKFWRRCTPCRDLFVCVCRIFFALAVVAFCAEVNTLMKLFRTLCTVERIRDTGEISSSGFPGVIVSSSGHLFGCCIPKGISLRKLFCFCSLKVCMSDEAGSRESAARRGCEYWAEFTEVYYSFDNVVGNSKIKKKNECK